MTVDRAALIDAAEAHDVQECSEVYASPERGTNRFGLLCPCGWRSEDMPQRDKAALDRMALAHRLDAILALIASALDRVAIGESECARTWEPDTLRVAQHSGEASGLYRAADLVRSLLGTDGDR